MSAAKCGAWLEHTLMFAETYQDGDSGYFTRPELHKTIKSHLAYLTASKILKDITLSPAGMAPLRPPTSQPAAPTQLTISTAATGHAISAPAAGPSAIYQLTKLGRAILQGGFQVDAAAVLFDALDQASRSGLLLSTTASGTIPAPAKRPHPGPRSIAAGPPAALPSVSSAAPLHVLYLVAPHRHMVEPNFPFLFNALAKYTQHANQDQIASGQASTTISTTTSNSSSSSSGGGAKSPQSELCFSVGKVLSALEADLGVLLKWVKDPPSRDVCSDCERLLRLEALGNDVCRGSGGAGEKGERSRLTRQQLRTLCVCKRLAGALAVSLHLGNCASPHALSVVIGNAVPLDSAQLQSLVTSTQAAASQAARLCAELGWQALHAIIVAFKARHLDPADKVRGMFSFLVIYRLMIYHSSPISS